MPTEKQSKAVDATVLNTLKEASTKIGRERMESFRTHTECGNSRILDLRDVRYLSNRFRDRVQEWMHGQKFPEDIVDLAETYCEAFNALRNTPYVQTNQMSDQGIIKDAFETREMARTVAFEVVSREDTGVEVPRERKEAIFDRWNTHFER